MIKRSIQAHPEDLKDDTLVIATTPAGAESQIRPAPPKQNSRLDSHVQYVSKESPRETEPAQDLTLGPSPWTYRKLSHGMPDAVPEPVLYRRTTG